MRGEEGDRYQRALRGLGQWLDEQGARHFTIVETTDGFEVTRRGQPETHFTRVALDERVDAMIRARSRRQSRDCLSPVSGGHVARYADVLRAVGYELDFEGACRVILLCSDLVLMVSFIAGDSSERREVDIPPDDVADILSIARSRRRPTLLGRMLHHGPTRLPAVPPRVPSAEQSS
ncbi:MAG TPA: hypothetical protein VFB58_08895 [Chloroflexota bacterium]|nr:hypothetical protein [Chloroflexota bacterium]